MEGTYGEGESVTAWLALWTEGERARAGEVYDDVLGSYYSWDSTVPHHATVAVGDQIVLWNSKTLLGISVMSAIESGPGQRRSTGVPSATAQR